MTWVFIGACIAAIAGIAYGILVDGKKKEKLGLSSIKKWDKTWIPLTLIVDEEFAADEHAKLVDALKAAAKFWNREVVLKLFAAPGELEVGGHVVPIMRDPMVVTGHEGAVAFTSLRLSIKGIKSAAVYMVDWENLSTTILARTMKHELGHCLGLEHDEIEFSVMYGKTSARVYCVSPADKAFLKEVYG